MKKIASIFAVLTTLCTFSASAAYIDFDSVTVDSYGGGQDKIGTATASGTTLSLTGNVWKSVSGTFDVTSDTLLKFEFFSDVEGEISGIGFNDNAGITGTRTFQIAGTQNYGNNTFDTYNVGDGWSAFTIDVGNFYTGSFDRIFFVMDDDSGNLASNGAFRNVEVCSANDCMTTSAIPEPAMAGLIALGLLGLRRRLK